MRGLFKALNFKSTAILFSLMLTACGSGGGGLNLGGGGGTGCDDTPVGKSPLDVGASIQSKDKRATVDNPGPLPVKSVTIAVNCISNPDGQIGRAYDVTISESGPVLTLSYKDVPIGSIPESDLRLGYHDPDTGWEEEQAAVQDIINDQFTLSLVQSDEYALFVSTTGGGTGSPPTTPTNVRASVPNTGVCTILISWDQSTDPDNDITSYSVSRSGQAIGTVTVSGTAPQCAAGQRCTFQDNETINPHPIQGTIYTYTVKAVDSLGHQSDDGIGNPPVTAPSVCPAQ